MDRLSFLFVAILAASVQVAAQCARPASDGFTCENVFFGSRVAWDMSGYSAKVRVFTNSTLFLGVGFGMKKKVAELLVFTSSGMMQYSSTRAKTMSAFKHSMHPWLKEYDTKEGTYGFVVDTEMVGPLISLMTSEGAFTRRSGGGYEMKPFTLDFSDPETMGLSKTALDFSAPSDAGIDREVVDNTSPDAPLGTSMLQFVPESEKRGNKKSAMVHGVVMTVIWAFLVPAAIYTLSSRPGASVFFKGFSLPFVTYAVLVSAAALATLAAGGIALAHLSGRTEYSHREVGIVLMVLSVVQVMTLFFACGGVSRHSVFRYVQTGLGSTTWCVSVVQMLLGVKNLERLYGSGASVPVVVLLTSGAVLFVVVTSIAASFTATAAPEQQNPKSEPEEDRSREPVEDII